MTARVIPFGKKLPKVIVTVQNGPGLSITLTKPK